MRIVALAIFSFIGINLFAGGSLIMLDGSKVDYRGDVGIEMQMLALNTPDGKMLISKKLVNWKATYSTDPDVVERFAPDQKPQPRKRERRNIEITNKSLKNLKPDQGLVERPADMVEVDTSKIPATKTQIPRPVKKSVPEIDTIKGGKEIDLNDHLSEGKLTIFDFYADWCGPCRRMDPHLKALVKRHPDKVALKKIDIINWGSPVAKQYRLRSIPHLRVLDDKGKVVRSGGGEILNYLNNRARSW